MVYLKKNNEMLKLSAIIIFIFFLPLFSFAQKFKTVTLIEQRNYYLNGGARASLGGKSRVDVRIDLPPKTISWYYSFSTTPDEKATKLLNLSLQLASNLSSLGAAAIATSGIEVPTGSGSLDVYVLHPNSRDAFLQKQDERVKYYQDVSLKNAKQAVQSVNSNYGSSFYLGLKNPSMMDGINVELEVVAIVEEVDENLEKAAMYCNLGWKAYERGELEKCLELTKKALEISPNHSASKFNIAFIHLLQEENKALEEYINAISELKKDVNAKQVLAGALADIAEIKKSKPTLKYLSDIEELLNSEFNRM